MPPNKSWFKRQKVPFSPGSFQYGMGVYIKYVEYFSQFIDKSDVDISLRILNHFSRLSHFDRRGQMRPRNNYRLIQFINSLPNFRRRARGYFQYFLYRMLFIARVDALR